MCFPLLDVDVRMGNEVLPAILMEWRWDKKHTIIAIIASYMYLLRVSSQKQVGTVVLHSSMIFCVKYPAYIIWWLFLYSMAHSERLTLFESSCSDRMLGLEYILEMEGTSGTQIFLY